MTGSYYARQPAVDRRGRFWQYGAAGGGAPAANNEHPRDPAGKQLAGFSTAPERRNTVVNDMFVHATRFNHP